MPTIDTAAVVKAMRLERMRTLKAGDFITLDAAPAVSMMIVDGKPMVMTPSPSAAEIEAERKRKADADRAWFLRSLGPW